MKTLFLMIAMTALSSAAQAAPAKAPAMPESAVRPSKKLDFEDGVVEGLNKHPLDFAQQLSEADKRSKIPHLYKKRTDFGAETAETLKQMRYDQ